MASIILLCWMETEIFSLRDDAAEQEGASRLEGAMFFASLLFNLFEVGTRMRCDRRGSHDADSRVVDTLPSPTR